MKKKAWVAGVAVIVLVMVGVTALRYHTQSQPASPGSSRPSMEQISPKAAQQVPADCHLPGPAPAMPDGHTADVDTMRQSHDNIQGFVLQLEAYQACRNNQVDHAASDTQIAQKQAWLNEGNDAVDQANALAQEFAAQLRVFKGRRTGK